MASLESKSEGSFGPPKMARTLSRQHSIPEEPFSPTRKDTLLSRQDDLPKMPFLPLEDVAQKYLSAVLPLLSADQQATTKSTVDAFVSSAEGKHLYDVLQQYDAKEDNYMEHFYREIYTSYDGSNHSLNPNFVLTVDPALNTAPKRAASVTFAALHYHQAVKTGKLPIFETRAGPLCMRQMPWLFGTARIAHQVGVDDINVNHIDSSVHVAVLCQGQVHKLTVLGADGALATSPELLEQRFAEIAAASSTATAASAVGTLTAADRGVWYPERTKMLQSPSNAAALAAVDEALFVVALDSVTGLTPEQMELNVLYGVEGTYPNRWLDKWTLVVCEDGQAGVNWEHSMLDGHTMMEFVAAVGSGQYRLEGAAVGTADATTCTVETLPWTADADTQAAIAETVAKCSAKSGTVGISTLEFSGFGASFIKSCKCSPDGFVQAAMMLTFYDMYGKLPAPYESVLTKAYKHGRVTVARNMSKIIGDEIKAFDGTADAAAKIEGFRKIVGEVSRICKEAATAQEFDRPFMMLRNIAGIEEMSMDICKDDGWARMSNLDLCTSHCGKGCIRFFGFEPPSATGFGVGYAVGPAGMQFSINNFSQAESDKFTAAVEARLLSLQQVFSA